MKHELFIALGDAAEAYESDYNINDVEEAINENYAPSLIHKEFETDEQMRAFQDGLEFCAEECSCGMFWVICPENDEERELLMSLSL